MAIKEHNVHLISQLARAASDLAAVTNSDNATNNILARIEELAKDEPLEKGTPGINATITAEATSRAEADSTNQAQAGEAPGRSEPKTALEKWGDFANLASNPKTTIAELRAVVIDLGYTGLGISIA